MNEKIKELLRDNIIKENDSSFASPIMLILKKDYAIRMCVDYHKLNKKHL